MAAPLVVVGGSAGAVEALQHIVAELPSGFPASVLVVVHLTPSAAGVLPRILSRAGPLPARQARNGDQLGPGVVLVAPPDHHLLVRDGRAWLSGGPKQNRHRPAIDPLFTSAAKWYGADAVAVVLSGALDDG